ncbi:MAG: tRNA (5-methylaminomethyl-2-thiouridine)(34)-methyltransferase MnmD [Sediminibacterium sp.]|nr:tRNA (5-methylaminomethyl-2-thiouridine)(34)-methyltransferase MnmD [Sediminibacterium sp.]
MERIIQQTADGSHTILIPEMQTLYHSKHGAIQESMHVFIRAGLQYFPQLSEVRILEVGFGTGLNALLTAIEAARAGQSIEYTSLEAYPLTPEEFQSLNHGSLLQEPAFFKAILNSNWNEWVSICPHFRLQKLAVPLESYHLSDSFSATAIKEGRAGFHCIYFDAFAPSAQPELWTADTFQQLYQLLLPGGILVTYCSKTVVRRAMEAAGFVATRIQGPYGKREMVRAIKQESLR